MKKRSERKNYSIQTHWKELSSNQKQQFSNRYVSYSRVYLTCRILLTNFFWFWGPQIPKAWKLLIFWFPVKSCNKWPKFWNFFLGPDFLCPNCATSCRRGTRWRPESATSKTNSWSSGRGRTRCNRRHRKSLLLNH